MCEDAVKSSSQPAEAEPQKNPLPFKGKARKEFVRRLIATGRYTINALDGTPITDWKRLFNDLHEPSAAEALDGEKPIPTTEIIQPSPEIVSIPRPAPAPRVQIQSPAIIIGAKKYTNRQLEHFGDAIFAITGRVMVHEQCSTDQRLYFDFSGQLIRNDNLGHGDVRRGTAAEIDVGTCYVEHGITAAMEHAKGIIEQTLAWKNLVGIIELRRWKGQEPPAVSDVAASAEESSAPMPLAGTSEVKPDAVFCVEGSWMPWRVMTQEQKAKLCRRKVEIAQVLHHEADEKWWSAVNVL